MFPRQSARTGVPSRNALRVLRQLAFAGSAIGAIGGFCAVGTITYDLHRRVRFAERIVESKRSLQTSCPNYNAGAGAATVAQMMEAAEAGKFLGLASFKKRSERQRHQLANSPEANMDRADGADPRESHTTGVSDNSIDVANESFETAGQTPREALKPPVRSSAISQPQGIVQVPPQPSFFLNKYKPKLKSRKEVRTDLAYSMSVPPEFREKYQDLPPSDPSLAVQRLLDHHMLDEATLRFLRDANATLKTNEEARNDIAVHLLYTSLHRNRIHLAQKLFNWFEVNQKLTPALWEIMLLAMWKNGRFESLATLYLKYAKEFELTPVLLRVVLKSLISSHRLSEAKTVLFKYVGNDTDCGACGIYLGGLWSRTRSIVLMETQFRKLLDTLASCRISPTEKLFDPLLGAYVEFGMSDKADMLVKTMQDTYNIPLKTRTLGLVAYGKAVNCDWDGKGTVEMVEEILQTVKEKGWKLKLERPYFMELLQEARLSAKCSPTGLWRMFRATEQKYGYAATSRQVLGYDATSFPLNESEKKPNSQETAAMWRRAMSMPESSRHIRQFTPLHTQMMYFINAGKPELSLTSFQDAKKSGMIMKHLHLDLAVTASILLHGDTRDAKTILQEFETLQLPSKPVTSQFFQAVIQASEMGEIEAVKMAVLNFYNIRQQKLLPVKHHAASTVAARLLDIGNNAAVLDMFRAINQSKYTAFAPFDPVAIKFIARAFYRSGNFKGVRWAIFTGLKRPSAVNRDLCDEISFIVSRSKNIYPLPNNYTRESFNREMAHISKLARILRHTFKARKFGPDRFISFPEAIEMLKGQASTPGSNTGSGNGLEKGPQLKGYKFEDLRYTDYIVRNWKERAELEKCFSPDAAEERDWSESGVFADGAEDPFEEPTMEESARLRVV
ncbi:predicted protein [Histoplasma mississippiense (nom. inval.)]|uniref:predicted protein n=1 Tax=Ajellomyces capsulatus (strain NAm1 / WU24) TaxID=2059318 RepID=UPI000157BECE|nr:predicted protein [Histoplasma mississippiense (nom. inval.)]EDN06353.1 predicted protein [Histoplasma mississippiense (nom. inval.)]